MVKVCLCASGHFVRNTVERLLQIGSAKGVARMMQRAGRSGHAPGRASRLTLVPTNTMEIIEAAAAPRRLCRPGGAARVAGQAAGRAGPASGRQEPSPRTIVSGAAMQVKYMSGANIGTIDRCARAWDSRNCAIRAR